MDIIFIEKLTVMTFIGIYEWEQKCLQKLVFDLELGWNNEKAIFSQNIKDCLNYSDISNTILNFVSKNRFILLENVAEEVANQLMNQFKIPWLRIKVKKSGVVPKAMNVGIMIERGKKRET